MTRRGFTLMEVMIATALVAIVTGSLSLMAWSFHKIETTSRAYHDDLAGLRRAVQAVERDLRADSGARYELDGTTLRRDGAVVARRIAVFEVEHDGPLATIRLELAPRSTAPSPRRARIEAEVWMR